MRRCSVDRPPASRSTAFTLLREHGFGRDVVELLLAHNEKNATVAANSQMEPAADRKSALSHQLVDDLRRAGCAHGEAVASWHARLEAWNPAPSSPE